MNKSYRTIWNEAIGAWVAASELDSARGKPNKSSIVSVVALLATLMASPAFAQYSAGGGYATGVSSVAIGTNSSATAADGVAIGNQSTASNGTNVAAFGPGAYANAGGQNDASAYG